MEEFKSFPELNDLHLFRLTQVANIDKTTRCNELSDIDSFQILSLSKGIKDFFQKHDTSTVYIYMDRLAQILEVNESIPRIECIFSMKIVDICLNYFSEEHEINSAIQAGRILAAISSKSFEYAREFAKTNILHVVYDKMTEGKHELFLYGITVARNLLFEDSLLDMFNDFYINELCEFSASIEDPREAKALLDFFNIFIMKKETVEFADNLQIAFKHLIDIIGNDANNILLNILMFLAYKKELNYEICLANGYLDIIATLFDGNEVSYILFYSFLYSNIAESRLTCPLDMRKTIEYLLDTEERDDNYMNIAAAYSYFVSILLMNDDIVDDQQLLVIAKWIVDGNNYSNFTLKRFCLILMNAIISHCGKPFIEEADIVSIFEFMNDAVPIVSDLNIGFLTQSMLTFAKRCDMFSLDVKDSIFETDYISTLTDIIDDNEDESSPEISKIFDEFHEFFSSED